MRVYLECTPDETLAVAVGVPKRMIIHSHGKGRVSNELAKNSGVTGLVDEDPGDPEPSRLRQYAEVPMSASHDLRLRVDNARKNRLVVICPRLEPWLLKTAKSSDVKMEDFGLSSKLAELDELIILRIPKVEMLLAELLKRNNPRLLHLKSLLQM